LKDKLQFFKDPREHLVTREPDNIIRYLHYVEGLTEEEAQAIISKWQEVGFVQIVRNQVILMKHNQEGDKDDNN
jgi:uncharacterized protein YdiU (UPF0061 family)